MPRTILITGGGTGIGLAMAKLFSAAGDKVIIVGRREAVLQAVVCELNLPQDEDGQSGNSSSLRTDLSLSADNDNAKTADASGISADYVVADLSKPDEVSKLRETLHQKHIQAIDVLINNAGASTPRQGDSLQEIAEQHIKNYEANVLSAALTTEALKHLIASPNGRIINLSSIAALRGGGPAYSAAKPPSSAGHTHWPTNSSQNT